MAFTKQRWIVGGLVVVGALLLISEHGRQTSQGTGTSSTGCTVTITADVLNARSRPDRNAPVVDTYSKGEVVSANRTIQNGFRQLREDRWVAQEFIQPTPGSDCG